MAPRMKALDVACGSGRDCVLLGMRGWEAAGVDYLERQVVRAREFATQCGVGESVAVVCHDVEGGKDENLNAPGMHFVPLAFASPCLPDLAGTPDCPPNRFYAYGVVARLALVAAAVELEETEAAFEESEAARPVQAAGA